VAIILPSEVHESVTPDGYPMIIDHTPNKNLNDMNCIRSFYQVFFLLSFSWLQIARLTPSSLLNDHGPTQMQVCFD
jgi:hypothetical protein